MQNKFKLVVYYQFIFMYFPRCNTMLLVIAHDFESCVRCNLQIAITQLVLA